MSEEKLSLTAVEKIQGLLLIDFFAPWCGPCRTMSPIIDEIKEEYNGKIVVEKVNVDENGEFSEKFNIMSIPAYILFKDGKVVEQITGARTKDSLKEMLDKHL